MSKIPMNAMKIKDLGRIPVKKDYGRSQDKISGSPKLKDNIIPQERSDAEDSKNSSGWF